MTNSIGIDPRRLRFYTMATAFICAACAFFPCAFAQIPIVVGNAPGVYVDPDGTVKRRVIDEHEELAAMRARVKAAQDAGKNATIAFVSLPKAFGIARAAIDAGQSIPDEVKYLGGLTQIKFVFVYPDSKDLILAGPTEAVQVMDELHAFGKTTGRPVLRMEDLVVAMRVVRDSERRGAFGCRLDPDPASPERVRRLMEEMARSSRAERVKAFADALGPQKVSFYGKVPDDSRFALVMIAADYELKRYGLGLARSTVGDLWNIVDNTRAAVNMIWYALSYEPILVSPEGDAYGFRGPRLKVEAGGFDWEPKGATPKAFEFARKMSRSMDALATNQPMVAELQNLADLSVLSALIQRDRLDEKVGWDTDWIRQERGEKERSFPVTKVTVPKTADALSTYTNGSIAGGGVLIATRDLLTLPAETDAKKTMDPAKAQAAWLRKELPEAAVLRSNVRSH